MTNRFRYLSNQTKLWTVCSCLNTINVKFSDVAGIRQLNNSILNSLCSSYAGIRRYSQFSSDNDAVIHSIKTSGARCRKIFTWVSHFCFHPPCSSLYKEKENLFSSSITVKKEKWTKGTSYFIHRRRARAALSLNKDLQSSGWNSKAYFLIAQISSPADHVNYLIYLFFI
jgi:hypothetical protein